MIRTLPATFRFLFIFFIHNFLIIADILDSNQCTWLSFYDMMIVKINDKNQIDTTHKE